MVPECLVAGRSGVRRLTSVRMRWKAGLLHREAATGRGGRIGCVCGRVGGCAGAERVAEEMMWSSRRGLAMRLYLAGDR